MKISRDIAKGFIQAHEGLVLKVYKDSVGISTIGYGRNLEAVGLSREEAEYLLENDLKRCIDALEELPVYNKLDPMRQAVLIDMCFNLGFQGLLGFKKFIKCLEVSDWEGASKAMLSSVWANQVGHRAKKLSTIIRGALT